MISRLDRIKDWESPSKETNYSTSALAKRCGVSPRQLERYFVAKFNQTPHQWLHEARLRRALELLCDGSSVKEVASLLGYRVASHFSQDFKHTHGIPPSHYPAQNTLFHTLRP
jgi:AraC family transcriptional regulator